MKKFIWIFGENQGNTFDNNSYYFWDQVCDYKDEIDKYLVLVKNKKTEAFYNSLPQDKKDKIIWKNTIKHLKLFKKADMYFVTLSYKDILPEKIFGKNIKLKIKKALIYLQHGTIAIKKLGYKGNTYNNNIFRFIYYNPQIKECLKKDNEFNDYQLYYGEFHPRYKKTVEYYLEKKKSKNNKKKILFFITWREYFGNNFETKKFINKLNKVFKDERLVKFINDNKIEIELCMHQFFDEEKISMIKETIKDSTIKLLYPSEVNLMKELATCDLLITDYSSVGFDCSLLNIPVILFQPDCEEYFKYRDTYCTVEELKKYNITKPNDLVEKIISNNYKLNEFFTSRLPKKVNYQSILKGEHIKKMYDYFRKLQLNKITILGYNFTGKGGTVSATKALAEALLEREYLVELMSMKMTEKQFRLPYGLSINSFYNNRQNKWKNRIKRHLFRNQKDFYYFKYDINKSLLFPYIGKALRKYLENTNSKTIISTRESLHLFVNNFSNKDVKNKLYFYHTDSRVLESYYPKLLDEIKKYELDNCIFVTEASKEAYKKEQGYTQYKRATIIGNSLESKLMIKKEDIIVPESKDEINVVSLIRLSKDREEDVKNIIDFGKFLLEKNVNNIKVNIYGQGELSQYLENEILNNDLEDIIIYKGSTNDPKSVMLENDCVVDFCNNQSFGMVYIESILNGRIVFAKENIGSLEVLKEIPEAYYHSNEELLRKIQDIYKISKTKYEENYDIISKKYSRHIVANKIQELLKDEKR